MEAKYDRQEAKKWQASLYPVVQLIPKPYKVVGASQIIVQQSQTKFDKTEPMKHDINVKPEHYSFHN